jgi:hypothetical protein
MSISSWNSKHQKHRLQGPDLHGFSEEEIANRIENRISNIRNSRGCPRGGLSGRENPSSVHASSGATRRTRNPDPRAQLVIEDLPH